MKNWENAGSIEKWAENCKMQGLNPIDESLRLKEIDTAQRKKGNGHCLKIQTEACGRASSNTKSITGKGGSPSHSL